MLRTCLTTCFDSETNAFFQRDQKYEVDETHPCAKHFGLKPKKAVKQAAEAPPGGGSEIDLT
jgi:hypothetical protein